MKNNTTIGSVDLAKLIASLFIFSMHANALGDFSKASIVLELSARWGVPFFFISSSFFLFRNNTNGVVEKKTIIRYSVRISKLYALWFLINLPSVYYSRLYGKDICSPSTLLVFFKNSLLSSTFKGSWYLVSSIFSAWAVFLLCKHFKTKRIVVITSIPFLVCALSSLYAGLLPESVRNILFFFCFPLNIFNGCFYFALGKMLAENSNLFKTKFTLPTTFLALIVFYMIYIIEVVICSKAGIIDTTDVGFSLPIIGLLLMGICLQIRFPIKNSAIMRKLSTIIFCCQGNILIAGAVCTKILKIHSYLIRYFIMSIMIGGLCIFVLFIQNRTEWKWTKYLT